MNPPIETNYGAQFHEHCPACDKKKTGTAFADKLAEKAAYSPKYMSLGEYKQYFQEKVNQLFVHPSQKNLNWIIEITDAAYERMRNEPEYEKKVLEALAKSKAIDFGGCVPQIAYIHIDDTWEGCHIYTGGIRQDNFRKSQSEIEREIQAERKKRRKRLLEEYLKKRAKEKRLLEKHWIKEVEERKIENSCLLQSVSRKRQMQQAVGAYEEKSIIETMDFCSSRCRKH
ncbi:MAG: hypothetical protein NC412_03200 [Roseburia sp.]|nr:hypothetical protein [Roseburia sp.]MCM1278414.1 hypothetical protein [Robinsoniella sp.]